MQLNFEQLAHLLTTCPVVVVDDFHLSRVQVEDDTILVEYYRMVCGQYENIRHEIHGGNLIEATVAEDGQITVVYQDQQHYYQQTIDVVLLATISGKEVAEMVEQEV